MMVQRLLFSVDISLNLPVAAAVVDLSLFARTRMVHGVVISRSLCSGPKCDLRPPPQRRQVDRSTGHSKMHVPM